MRGEYSWKLGCRGPRGGDSAHQEGLVSVTGAQTGVGDNRLTASSPAKDKSTRIDSESRVVNNTLASARYFTRKKISGISQPDTNLQNI